MSRRCAASGTASRTRQTRLLDRACAQALARELNEELGVTVDDVTPFRAFIHAYPNKKVDLQFFRVGKFTGTPYGREGQQIRWLALDQLNVSEFLAANRPVIKALQLPDVYAISQMQAFGVQAFEQKLMQALTAGLRLVQFREPEMPEDEFKFCARHYANVCHRHGARLLINAAPEWAKDCGADGVHLPGRLLMSLRTRPLPETEWVGASCHNREEIQQAERIGVDFITLSPVARTTSHPDVAPIGWSAFTQLSRTTALPAYALGGLRYADVPRAKEAGADAFLMKPLAEHRLVSTVRLLLEKPRATTREHP